MTHMFDVEIALQVGIKAAIIFQNIAFWCEHSRANETHFHDGEHWTFASVKALQTLFPYLTEKQIREAVKRLLDEGLIKKGNYNKSTYDRTTWYALTEKGKSICPIGQMEVPEMANRSDHKGEPIPDIITDINTDTYKSGSTHKKRSRETFIKPTVREIADYAYSIDYNLDAQYFYDYYEDKNWKPDGKPIRNWKLKVQSWKKHDEQRGLNTHAKHRTDTETEYELDEEQLAAIARINAAHLNFG